MFRKIKGDSVPSAIMRTASSFDIYVIYKRRVITRTASTAPSSGNLMKTLASFVCFFNTR